MLRKFAAPILASLALAGCATPPVLSSAETLPSAIRGAVSAADPRAEDAGREMLRAGGSATDAAIAVMLALTVVEPQSSGIGGGGFYVRASHDGAVETIDGREAAPAAATPEWFLDANGEPLPFMQAVQSGLSIGVPGNIALAAKAHEKHGKLPWAKLFDPAIRLAEGGLVMNGRLNTSLDKAASRAGYSEEGRALYFGEDGKPLPVGTRIDNPELAATFRRIAALGPRGYYSGEDGAALAAKVASATPREGAMTVEDVANYEAKERPGICAMYRAYRVCGMGPPTSGSLAVILILKQLERFDLASLGPQSPEFWHLFIESQRLSYADRTRWVADPDYVDVPLNGLLDPDYIAQRSALIDPASTISVAEPGMPEGAPVHVGMAEPVVEHGTSHLAVVDADGNMVSYTSTVEGAFGSGLMLGGYFLNNELTDFDRKPVDAAGKPLVNRVEGGKRPRSAMSPMVVFGPDGKSFLGIGGGGGGFIPTQTAKGIVGVIDFGLPLEEALSLPLLLDFGSGLYLEADTFLSAMAPSLEALGHANIRIAPQPFGSVAQVAVQRDGDGWIGARDNYYKGTLLPPE